jgi:hypothetical protein
MERVHAGKLDSRLAKATGNAKIFFVQHLTSFIDVIILSATSPPNDRPFFIDFSSSFHEEMFFSLKFAI